MRSKILFASAVLFGSLLCVSAPHAALSIYVPPEELARRAELIVEATVVSTASGFDPRNASLSTYVTLAIEAVHRGPPELERAVLREAGGRAGVWVHDVDAVPVYLPGERVFVFLEPGRDGALRTVAMFFGKYTLRDSEFGVEAVRELGGRGRILHRPAGRSETMRLQDLIATAVTAQARRTRSRSATRPGALRQGRGEFDSETPRGWHAQPPEVDRIVWTDVQRIPSDDGARIGNSVSDAFGDFVEEPAGPSGNTRFAPSNPAAPARWEEIDVGGTVGIRLQPSANPLGDDLAAVAQLQRAVDAWNQIPESRVRLAIQDGNYDFTGNYTRSPAEQFSGVNVILFGDPYEDISDPSNCLGVLAIGGYWRSEALGATVNNVAFYPALQLYVIFNDGFECFLADPDNLAEVAAHELGHGLGFGHSTAPDAIMRAVAYGDRGPRLGDDDRDVAHCHYPHTLHLIEPNGGQTWVGGSLQAVRWSSTSEVGPDAGVVDLEYTIDGGASWRTIVSDEPNDGYYAWLVPYEISTDVRVRVIRPHRGDVVPSYYPATCSGDGSDAALSIAPPPLIAGAIQGGAGLRLQHLINGELELTWPPSCSDDTDDYVVYEGSLEALRSGVWDPQPATCSASLDLWESIVPSPGDRYYLVAPAAGPFEGSLGQTSEGAERPAAATSCLTREAFSGCY